MRLICFAVLLAGAVPAVYSQTPAPKTDPAADLRKAVENLAHPRFAVREQASKTLWSAGRAAETLIRAAANSTDEETSSRAKTILEKFDWGIYPDTPKDTLKLIEDFRGGDASVREVVLGKMMQVRPPDFGTLRKLIARETEPERRQQMHLHLALHARDAVPGLIVDGKLDEAGELLEICLSQNNQTAMGDFATFLYLRKQVDPAIARFEKQLPTLKGNDLQQARETLTYLYRVKGDWAKAKTSAADSPLLIEDVLWEANDWKELANRPHVIRDDGDDAYGLVAAYYRKAGDKEKFDKLIAEMKKELTGVEGDDLLAARVAKALFLNGEGVEAIKLLKDRPGISGIIVFDLLCAQLKYREAFAFADKALKEMEKEEDHEDLQQDLNFRRMVALANLGETDSAAQLSRKLLDQMRAKLDRAGLLADFVRRLVRANQRDLALEWAAKASAVTVVRRGDREYMMNVFNALYDNAGLVQFVWWDAIRITEGDKDAAGQMRRVEKLSIGKGAAADIGLIEKFTTSTQTPRDRRRDMRGWSAGTNAYAMAELHRRHGDAKKADAAYRTAVDLKPDVLPKARFNDDLDFDLNEVSDSGGRVVNAYADFLMKEGRHKEAAAMYERVWKVDPSQPLPLFLRGQALAKAGDEKAGRALIEAAHWVPLGDESLRGDFCEELSKLGYDDDAKRELKIILDAGWFRSFEVGNMYLRVARNLARKKEYAKAAEFYEKDVISLFRTGASFQEPRAYLTVPELARAYRLRAMVAAGKIDDALKSAKESLDLLPGNVELAIDLVPELEKAGRKPEADALYTHVRDAYAAAIKDFGASADLRNSVAWVMVNCNRDLAEAKSHAEKAVALKPDAAGYIDTLAEVHFRLKDRPKALELMKKCAAIEPKNPYFRKQLERFEEKGFDSRPPDEETGED